MNNIFFLLFSILNSCNYCHAHCSARDNLVGDYVHSSIFYFRFLKDAAEIIVANIECEGVFRKSGAVSRQKEIKVRPHLKLFLFALSLPCLETLGR